ncbi:GrlR family regulatory protein [Sporomusa acidovorans]|uniref:Polymer-forming cytoskeletal n=1 Tax=Sporomusa acidovorans (strain ATCC 49682 / DSM 3132 / Mol) TaxID=1123286 RepID=A0ABZ3J4F8_SPOA4|nr:GrlR family regulatory protein [Sporomusa acidovorans]OZC20286.1 hypothetical protein SPACI_26840 [Sporomusa acidovorans DSM 3132]SDD39189.1 T3SS negative regulator,GrlR [Sporomusa acidovorans]
MTKSLWSIKFESDMKDFGSRVVMLDGDQVVGGDMGYYYLGKCTISGSSASAVITITKHNRAITSVFGDINSFKLTLTGNVNGDQISLSGNVEGFPQMKLTATMKKIVNLAYTLSGSPSTQTNSQNNRAKAYIDSLICEFDKTSGEY